MVAAAGRRGGRDVSWEEEVREIERRQELVLEMGGPELVEQEHAGGKLTVRERIDGLLDSDSFEEQGRLAGTGVYEDGELKSFHPSGVVLGAGRIDGRRVIVTGSDYTARRAPPNRDRPRPKGGYAEQMALEMKVPLIKLIDAFGANIRAIEQMSRTYIPEMPGWWMNHALMAEVPVVAAALGSVAGGPAAEAAATHFTVMVRGNSQIFAAGPPVVIRALGLEVTKEELGGADVHARGSGLADNEAESEADALQQIRRFLSYLPSNVYQVPPIDPEPDDTPDRRDEELLSIVPRDRQRPYDVRQLVEHIVDRGSAFEIGRYFGGSQITMFARMDGRPIGVLANDPRVLGGSMDAASAEKFTKFVDLCDAFNLPIVNFADQPGFMIGPSAERAGTLKKGVRALAAIYDASVPWATVVVRRLYGVAGAAHQSHHRHAFRIAWPSGEWGSIPIEGGVMAAYRRQIENAPDPDAERARIEQEFVAVRNPLRGAEAFDIEDLIDPRDTRPVLCNWVRDAYERLPLVAGKKSHHMRP
jgi:acetyl-CoA carboxylase carboxyltransferase component